MVFLVKTGINDVRRKNERYLLLLDINMPKMDGLEVLRRIRKTDENLPVYIFRKDRAGRFTFANKLFCERFGRSPDQVIGTPTAGAAANVTMPVAPRV